MPINQEVRIDSVSGDTMYIRISDERIKALLDRNIAVESDGIVVIPVSRLIHAAIPDSSLNGYF